MWVNPFWLGVIVTIVAEVVGLMIIAVVNTCNRGSK